MAPEALRCRVRYRKSVGADLASAPWGRADGRLLISGAPVRAPGWHRGQSHYPGFFWSTTLGKTIMYESLLELDRLWLADFDPAVIGIACQPFEISGRDGVEYRRHIPDLLLQVRDDAGRRDYVVVDVKPAAFLSRPKVAEVFAWTGRLCREKGWRYEVFTGADSVRLANIRFLAAGRRARLVDADVLAQTAEQDPAGRPLGDVESSVPAPLPAVRLAVLTLLWQNEWCTTLDRPLSSTSPLWAVSA